MALNFNLSIGRTNVSEVVRNNIGEFFYTIFNGSSKSRYKNDAEKLAVVLSSPATLKVFVFLADVFSQVRIDTPTQENYLYSVQKKPNQFQSWTDLFWEHRFWLALGNSYLYIENNTFYYLNPSNITLTTEQEKEFKKLPFSLQSSKNIKKGLFKYKNENGENQILDLKNLYIFADLSNGVSGNWFKGNSRLDALYKIINNSELSLDADSINLEFAGKFVVTGQHNPDDVSSLPMGEEEKNSAENSLRSSKSVHVLKDKVDVKQFVSNLASLKLDENYLTKLFLIANMYGIPKDVIEVLAKGSTYENQEKSLGRYIDYTEMPKVQQFTDALENILNVNELKGTFKHLPFNQVFEAEKVTNLKTQLEAYKIASELGVDVSKKVNDLINGY